MKYIKIEKDSIWWLAKQFIGLFSLFLIYKLFIKSDYSLTIPLYLDISPLLFLAFGGLTLLCLWFIHQIFFDLLPLILKQFFKLVLPGSFDEVKQYDVDIPIYQKDLELFNKKFKRKVVGREGKEKIIEYDTEFLRRIINDMIKKGLRGN